MTGMSNPFAALQELERAPTPKERASPNNTSLKRKRDSYEEATPSRSQYIYSMPDGWGTDRLIGLFQTYEGYIRAYTCMDKKGASLVGFVDFCDRESAAMALVETQKRGLLKAAFSTRTGRSTGAGQYGRFLLG